MRFPTVTEIPLQMEPVTPDPFIAAPHRLAARPVLPKDVVNAGDGRAVAEAGAGPPAVVPANE